MQKKIKKILSFWILSFPLILLIFFFSNFQKKEITEGTKSLKVDEVPNKPNVLFIVWDGMQPQKIGSYGAKFMYTPSLDNLSETGFTFRNCFVQQALCSPSRYTLLTGLRPDSLHIYDNHTPLRAGNPDVKTFPQLFHERGYETIRTGGVVPRNKKDDKEWDKTIRVSGDWKGKGYLTTRAINEMEEYHNNNSHAPKNKGPAWERANVPDSAYPDGKKTMEVIRQLRRLREENKPFFITIGLLSTHLPYAAPDRYWNRYPLNEVQLPDNFYLPKNKTKYSLTASHELTGYSNIAKNYLSVSDSTARILNRAYQAAVSYDDALTGRMLRELERLGLDKNTIVVFWSDHGAKIGEHRSWAKQTNYEIDTHVPLIVRVPWMEPSIGKSSDKLVESVDVYPSLAQLCNLQAPVNLQGNSFVPLMKDDSHLWKQAALSQYPREKGKIMGYSMRTENYRYTEWIQLSTGKVKAKELYDHRTDPEENDNVVEEEYEYGATIDSLSILLHERWKLSLTPGGFSSLMPCG